MPQVLLFPLEHYAQLISSGRGIFVKEFPKPVKEIPSYGPPQFFYFRVLENPQLSENFIPASKAEVQYVCEEDHEDLCQNKEEFKELLSLLDQMKSKPAPIPMEAKAVERLALEM